MWSGWRTLCPFIKSGLYHSIQSDSDPFKPTLSLSLSISHSLTGQILSPSFPPFTSSLLFASCFNFSPSWTEVLPIILARSRRSSGISRVAGLAWLRPLLPVYTSPAVLFFLRFFFLEMFSPLSFWFWWSSVLNLTSILV